MAKILDRIFSELIDNIFLVRAFSHLTSMGVQKPISRNSQGSLGGGAKWNDWSKPRAATSVATSTLICPARNKMQGNGQTAFYWSRFPAN